MNRQLSRYSKYGSRSMNNIKTDPEFKTIVRDELKQLIGNSIHDYLKHSRIPLASIDIKLDKECNHCVPENGHKDSSRSVRVNISTSTVDAVEDQNLSLKENKVQGNKTDNYHWMTWHDPVPCYENDKELMKSCRSRNECRMSARHIGHCSSPFARPSTAINRNNASKCTNKSVGCHAGFVELVSPRREAWSQDFELKNRSISLDRATETRRPRTSIGVGPDKHYEDSSTNTKQSYQISDYLKKSMDLNDPYERKVFSCLMEVLRKKNRSSSSIDAESIAADPIIQISEYRSRYRNPTMKVNSFPTSKTENNLFMKKPPLCPHKTRPLGQLRPHSSATTKFTHGEQFLY